MIDAHIHPYQLRRDVHGPEYFAEVALAQGLSGLVFTEHAPLWYHEPRLHFLTETELKRCLDDCLTIKKRWSGTLDIRVGIEADWHPRNADFLAGLLARHPQIECVSGSIHLHGPHWADETAKLDGEQCTALALRETLAAVRSGLFCRINHLDFFRVKLCRSGFEYHPERHEKAFREIFAEMAKRDIALEWNASGLRKPFSEAFPCPLVWRWSRDYPLRRTYGSDAHKPEDLGAFMNLVPPEIQRPFGLSLIPQ